MCHERLGAWARAEADARRATELRPSFMRAHVRAISRGARGLLTKAAGWLTTAAAAAAAAAAADEEGEGDAVPGPYAVPVACHWGGGWSIGGGVESCLCALLIAWLAGAPARCGGGGGGRCDFSLSLSRCVCAGHPVCVQLVHTAWPLSPLSCSTRHEYAFAIAATLYGSNRTLGTCDARVRDVVLVVVVGTLVHPNTGGRETQPGQAAARAVPGTGRLVGHRGGQISPYGTDSQSWHGRRGGRCCGRVC
jgi:hypothetical protein